MTREELQRLYDRWVECSDVTRVPWSGAEYTESMRAVLAGVGDFLAEPDPTVEIAYLKAKLADLSDEYPTRRTQGRRPPMSHDDIKAALESRTDLPWRPSHDGPVASDTYDVLDNDGETVAASLFYLDAHLIANAPTWLTELLAEVDRLARWKAEAFPVIAGLQELGAELGIPLGKRITGPDALAAVKALTARAEAAEQANQRVRELAQHYDGRAYTDATGAILRALDGGEQHG